METLPTEILHVIFNELHINDLINSVSHVCERWRRIIAEDTIRQDKVQVVISACTQVCGGEDRHQFRVDSVLHKEDLQILSHCRKLAIDFTADALSPCTFHYFPALNHSWSFLQTKTLNLSVTTDQARCYAPSTSSDFDMGSIIDIIEQYPGLEFLTLSIVFIYTEDAWRLINVLLRKTRLQFVEITLAIPPTNRLDYMEPLHISKWFNLHADFSFKINEFHMVQSLVSDDEHSDYDCGLPNLGFV